MSKKQCSKCQDWKEEYEFGKNRSQCRKCISKYYRDYRKSDAGKLAETRARHKYYATERGKQAYTRNNKKYRQTESYKISHRLSNKKYRDTHPSKEKARQAVNHAIRDGKISNINTQICSHCGDQATQYHHYKGYNKENWFDIIPLCTKCHAKEHPNDKLFPNHPLE